MESMKYFLVSLVSIFIIDNNAFSMTFEEAKNIINKTSIGSSPVEINKLLPLNINQGIDAVLDKTNTGLKVSPPEWVNQNISNNYKKNKAELKELRKRYNSQEKELKIWWYKQMIFTDSPLNERMTLFWHNHFTSSQKKVKIPKFMFHQNNLFRKHALGNFKDLLHDVSKDAAMIIYLDTQQNRKSKPNENFARELMELFTLGEGNYTETDVKEAARAFTGWKVDKETGRYIFDKRIHDNKIKTFMGRTGKFNGEDILNIILENPKTPLFITKKVWKEFIGINAPPKEIERIAKSFKSTNYDIKVLAGEILKSKYFNDKRNYASIIKSPIDLIIGTVRTLNIPIQDNNIEQMMKYGKRLGQDIFNPPNVKGWPGGYYWVNSFTLPLRHQLIQRMTRGNEWVSKSYQQKNLNILPSGIIIDLWVDSKKTDFNEIQNILLPITPVKNIGNNLTKSEFIRKIILDPSYQLR